MPFGEIDPNKSYGTVVIIFWHQEMFLGTETLCYGMGGYKKYRDSPTHWICKENVVDVLNNNLLFTGIGARESARKAME